MTQENITILKDYFAIRDELLALVEEERSIIRILQLETWIPQLDLLDNNLRAENFKVMIIGEFKTGKSTFINSLLRERVLPAFPIPCTAIINEVKWGEERSAYLHYFPDEQGNALEPLQIPIEDLPKYVVIQDQMNKKKDLDQNPFERAEVFWDLELCRNGVEIIDSPGLNENPKRQAITLTYLPKTDAVVFVCSSMRIGPSISEQRTIDDLHAYGYDDIFFVCNQIDMIDSSQRKIVIDHARSQLGQYSIPHGERRVFFISAKQALDGQLEESGLLPLESELTRFLAEDKGKLRFKRAARKLREAINDSRRASIYKEGMLKTKFDDLQERIQHANEELRNMQSHSSEIDRMVERQLLDTQRQVREKTIKFMNGIASQVEEWINEYEIVTPIRFTDMLRAEVAVTRVSEEIVTHVSERIDREANQWKHEEIEPFIMAQMDKLRLSLDGALQVFVQQLDDLEIAVAGVPLQAQAHSEKVSAVDRVLSTGVGLVVGGVGSGMMGAMFGYKEMVKSLIPQIAISVGVIVLFGMQPWLLIAALVGGGLAQGFLKMKATNDQIKRQIGEMLREQIHTLKDSQAESVSREVGEKLQGVRGALRDGLDAEVNRVHNSMNSVLERRERGEERQEQLLLDDASKRLNELQIKLDNFVDTYLVIAGE